MTKPNFSLKHLTGGDHADAAILLGRVQHDLAEVSRLVSRAPFTDDILRVMKAVQERIIDPLRNADSRTERGTAVPYPNVGYGISSKPVFRPDRVKLEELER